MTATSSCPSGSKRRARGAFDSGIHRQVSAAATVPTGTFTQKIQRQPGPSTSAPPTSGPSAMLRPTTAAQTPIARARSAGFGKTLTMMDIATGLSIDPPTAWTIRNATNQPRLGAKPQASEADVNATSPTRKTRRRPSRSPSDPLNMSSVARTSE